MRLPVGLGRADVLPVAVEAVLEGPAGGHQPRDQSLPEVGQPVTALGQLLERPEKRGRTVGEDLHRHHVGLGRVGFVLETHDPAAAVVHLDHSEPPGVLGHTGCGHGGVGVVLQVGAHQPPLVERLDRVGAEHQDDVHGMSHGLTGLTVRSGQCVARGARTWTTR